MDFPLTNAGDAVPAPDMLSAAARAPQGPDDDELDGGVRGVEQDAFRAIADWYHSAIVVYATTRGAVTDAAHVARAFGLSRAEAGLALARLVALGRLEPGEGGLVASGAAFSVKDKALTTPALKKHQRQILAKAVEALDDEDLANRSMTGMAMAVDPARLPEAKARIQHFMRDLTAFLEGGDKVRVYQLAVQLFPLQSLGD